MLAVLNPLGSYQQLQPGGGKNLRYSTSICMSILQHDRTMGLYETFMCSRVGHKRFQHV